MFDLWQQWWIGDQVCQVAPLRYLSIKDVNHLDSVQVGQEEMHGQMGKRKNNQQQVMKMLSDMRFLMLWVTSKVEAANARVLDNEITIITVDRMFQAVANEFSECE